MLESSKLLEYFPNVIQPAIWATLRMLSASIILGFLIGVVIAIILVLTYPKGLSPNAAVYNALSFFINAVRAFPVMILIVAIIPITRKIVGTSIGERAAIVPLTVAAFPVIARMIENSLIEVNENLITAAKSFGASKFQILFKVMFIEAMPSIVSGMTTTIILFLASTTIAGAVGAGGLGAVALTYGYQRFDDAVMYAVVFILFTLVLLIQGIGHFIYKKL